MTFIAIRPDFGLANGREISLFRVAQASGSISALRVVLSALLTMAEGLDGSPE